MIHARRFRLLPILGLILLGVPAGAATRPGSGDSHPWCGTTRHGFAIKSAIHRDHQRRLAAEGKALRSFPEASRVGHVAVLVDDGSLLVQPKQVDLSDFGVQYVLKKGAFQVLHSSDPITDELGEKLDLADDDVRLITFPKGFKFRFYNKVHTKMFVHSDGNITFNAGDAESTARSLDRLLGGPPRIAPFFVDLNPEGATGEAGVYVAASKAKVVVTWLDLPEFGQTRRNTFQVALYPSGRITFAFGTLQSSEAVVGVSPGGGGQVQLVDYTGDLPAAALKTAIAERFIPTQFLDDLAIAKAFSREFADEYDHLIVFLDFPHILEGNAFAYEFTIKNEIQGIGSGIFDGTALAGSKSRLRSFVQMGSLSRYPDDPEVEHLRTNSSLDLLAHESGHRWLATVNFIDGGGQESDALLGRQRAHWSFCHNSLASELEGNLLREDGGDRFTSIGATDTYSPLDLYLMGLIPPGDVPPFYYVDGCASREEAPQIGALIQGRRVDVTIDQVIAAEGPRVPAANKAPHSFNMAFIIVSPPGQFPSEEAIAKVDRLRAAWEPYFIQITDGIGTVNTELKVRRGRGRR
jgi:hypothetical protein